MKVEKFDVSKVHHKGFIIKTGLYYTVPATMIPGLLGLW